MDLSQQVIAWTVFAVSIFVMLMLDLGVFNRKEKDVSMKDALTWSFIWIMSAFVFCGAIYFQVIDAGGELKSPGSAPHAAAGHETTPAISEAADKVDANHQEENHTAPAEQPVVKVATKVPPRPMTVKEKTALAKQNALEFLTGYLIEEMLSVDNLFVFVLIFQFFRVPSAYQRTVLYWGILGAIVMRAIFIAAGIALIETFHFVIYLFGAFLVYTGLKLLWADEDDNVDPNKNIVLRIFRRFVRVTTEYHGRHFLVKIDGKKFATPLFVVLIVVETTDLIFAVDSIPAILSITRNPFIVYTSNVFAIMGLRSLYFALAGLMEQFHYLKYGLSIILSFVGIKMLTSDLYHMPVQVALGVVVGTLVLCVLVSIMYPPKHSEEATEEAPKEAVALPTQPAEEGGKV